MDASSFVANRTEQLDIMSPKCICANLNWGEILGNNKTQILSPFSALSRNANQGCHLCSLFYGALKTFDPYGECTRLTNDCPCLSDPAVQFEVSGFSNMVTIQVRCAPASWANHKAILQLSTLPHNLNLDFRLELRDINNRRRAGPEMVGLELDGLARAWINDCERSHKLCSRIQDGILPTRLIDVSGGGKPGNDLALVVSPKGSGGKWTALSYCWGTVDGAYRTTTSNFDEYLQRIPMDGLPRTIRDAVSVTQSLGIRYLWVDALCIVQDSKIDWQTEAPKMMNVYQNAYITIAANIGDNANAGLGIDRNLLESRPCKLQFRKPDDMKGTKYRWIHPPRQPWERIVGLAKLQTRGWTLQETQLAPRVIYYDQRGLYWQCQEGIRQERVPADLIMTNDLMISRRRIFDAYTDDPVNIFSLWQDLVRQFTERELTYQSDKLFAIAGIASSIAEFIKSRLNRRLASPEEKKMYRDVKLPKHWAVPDNPLAIGPLRHDGANASLRWIISLFGDGGKLYKGGPLSMDPWLSLRFIGELDPKAEREFENLSPSTREIMRAVGMEKLLEFLDDQGNPDYDDEYIQLMSHPDTHAAYQRAYQMWEAKNKTPQKELDTESDGPILPEDSLSPIQGSPKVAEQRMLTAESESAPHPTEDGIPIEEEPQAENNSTDDTMPIGATVNRDELSPLPKKLQKELAAVQEGFPLDPDMEIEPPFPAQAAIYIYGEDDPVKARTEWPGFVLDDTYLAGIWKADIFDQLKWFCQTPCTRAPVYRAPSWSWTSMDAARILYEPNETNFRYERPEGLSYTNLPRLLDARVVPRGENRFGDAQSARLVLLADVKDMPFHVDLGDETIHFKRSNRKHSSISLENETTPICQSDDDASDDAVSSSGLETELTAQEGLDEDENPQGVQLTDRGFPDLFPGSKSDLVRDEPHQQLEPMMKILRVSDSFCLLIDLVNQSHNPLVARRVGCWICEDKEKAFQDFDGEKGMVGWKSQVVILI